MRSITQTIILDRLQHALASRGVDLKRSAVLEVAAQAFGFLDGNAFVAAMKEERFAPPAAETIGTIDIGGTILTVLRDPNDGALQALDRSRLDPDARRDRYVVSPYGGVVSLADTPNAAEPPRIGSVEITSRPPTAKRDIAIVGDVLQDGGDAECRRYAHLLTDEVINIGRDPILHVSATRMAHVDGVLHLLFDFEEEYDDHEQGVLAARSFAAFEAENAARFEALGGFIMWQDRLEHGRIEFQAFLPASLADHVDKPEDWHDAVSILFGAEHLAVTATFQPQAVQNDYYIDVDPEGDVDFDVTIEILLMGAKRAKALRDNREETDALAEAVMAPDWIRNWLAASYVRVADSVAEYLDERAVLGASADDDDDEDWACDECGETLQDGSGVCITCGHDHNVHDDGECNVCEQRIDYDTGICTGCGHDHNTDEPANTADAGVLRTVLPGDADHLLRQTDGNDPV